MRNTITPYLSYNSIGHVIYEMSSGHVLSGVVPTEEECERVKYDEVKELLHFIFDMRTPIGSGLRLWKTSPHKKMMKKVANYVIMSSL